MDLSQLQAVLLDMDGTLVDSDAAVERSWRAWAAEYPVDPGRGPLIAHGLPALANVRHADLRQIKVTGFSGPLLSTHNVARFLEEQLDSILAQEGVSSGFIAKSFAARLATCGDAIDVPESLNFSPPGT